MDLSNKKILVVDDEPGVLFILKELYEELLGVQVLTAENGMEAFEIVQNQKVDLISTDFRMPIMDGAGLVKAVRETSGPNCQVGILVVTGFAADLGEQLAKFERVLIMDKPINEERLVANAKLLLRA